MNNSFRMPSMTFPDKYGFNVYADSMALWGDARRTRRPLCAWSGIYETYGDRNIQHSHETPVQDIHFADWCASLASHCRHNPDDLDIVAKNWPREDSKELLQFLATIRHKDGKRVYFSRPDKKTSSADSKRHDRRWEEIPEWANGSVSAVAGLLNVGDRYLIEVYAAWKQIADMHGTYIEIGEQLKLEGFNPDDSFTLIDSLVQSHRMRAYADRCAEVYAFNLSASRAKAEERQTA